MKWIRNVIPLNTYGTIPRKYPPISAAMFPT